MPDPFPLAVTDSRLQAAIEASRYCPTIAYAGGGIEIKGASVLLLAIPQLSQIKDLRILVAGSGEGRLLAKFREFEPTVQLLGWVPFFEVLCSYLTPPISLWFHRLGTRRFHW